MTKEKKKGDLQGLIRPRESRATNHIGPSVEEKEMEVESSGCAVVW